MGDVASCRAQGVVDTGMPDIKGVDTIPKNINVVMVVGSNISNPAMVDCCAPNKVQLLDGCYLWCKIPEGNFATNTNQTVPELTTSRDIFQNITQCLRLNGVNRSEFRGIGGNIPNTSGHVSSTLSTLGLGVWALVMFGVLMH